MCCCWPRARPSPPLGNDNPKGKGKGEGKGDPRPDAYLTNEELRQRQLERRLRRGRYQWRLRRELANIPLAPPPSVPSGPRREPPSSSDRQESID